MSVRKPVDIELLITRHLDGELSPSDVAVLQQWLCADPDNADAFVRRMIDHQRLSELTTAEPMVLAAEELESVDAPLGGVQSPNEDSGALLRDLLALEQGQDAAEPVDITQRVLEEGLAARREKALQQRACRASTDQAEGTRTIVIPKPLIWLGVAAVIGLLASVVWFNQPAKDTVAITSPPGPQRDTTPRDEPAAPVRVATVAGALDARFTDGQAVRPGSPVYNAPFDLAQGIVQLELTSGVTLTLEGPARLDLGTAMFVSLDHGKLVGLVPQPAHGFVVRTPTMDVVDLGTEFGIEVSPLRDSEVHVLDGSIRLEPGQYSQSFQPRVALAGHALTVVDAGAPAVIDARPEVYYRDVPSTYERMVRDAEPLAYWRFTAQDAGGRLAGLGAAQAALFTEAATDLRRDTPLQNDTDDRALWLGRRPGTLQSEQPIALDTRSAFTIEAWVWVPSDTDRRMRILSNNVLTPEGSHAGGYGLGVSGATGDHIRGEPVLLFTGYSVFDAFSQTPVPTDRWVHVSASHDGQGTLRMTIDGRPVAHRVKNDTGYEVIPGYTGELLILPSDGPTRVGNAVVGNNGPAEHWIGGIDEVAVYGRVLDEEELAAHARPNDSPQTRNHPPAR